MVVILRANSASTFMLRFNTSSSITFAIYHCIKVPFSRFSRFCGSRGFRVFAVFAFSCPFSRFRVFAFSRFSRFSRFPVRFRVFGFSGFRGKLLRITAAETHTFPAQFPEVTGSYYWVNFITTEPPRRPKAIDDG